MTRITANLVVLIMAVVWAWLSITSGMMQPVSDNFLYLGGLILFGEAGAAVDFPGKISKKVNGDAV